MSLQMQHVQQPPILFYSNFSPSSQTFLKLLTKYNLIDQLNVVCIDHRRFREKLSNSSVLKINKVPCLIKLYEGGTVEKFDDKAVFDWLENLHQRFNKVSIHAENELINDSLPPPPPPSPVNKNNNNNEDIKLVKINKKNRPKTTSNIEGTTNIGDILTDDDDDTYELNTSRINKPVTSLRTDSGNYEIEDFGAHEVQNNPNVIRGIKSSTDSASKSDILTLAQSMQKSREMADSENIDLAHINFEKSQQQA